ncbi:MAG: alpha/beta hydrolase family protein, partial [Actinomycetota bacterium]
LHGLPGIEKNYDLALSLRELGWNALLMHYRGCWGSAGNYSLLTLQDDARAALDYLGSSGRPQLGPGRLALIGHSMGGYTALQTGADERVRAVAVYGAVTDPARLPFTDVGRATELTSFLHGISPQTFIAEWNSLPAAFEGAASIEPTPLLVVHGEPDEVVSVEQSRLLEERLGTSASFVFHPDANHAFSWHRAWLRDTVLGWLTGLGL